MKLKILVAISVLIATAPLAIAETLAFKPGVYVGAELGVAVVKDNAQEVAHALAVTNGGSAFVTQDLSVGTGRIFAGYKIIENIDAEVGYFKTGDVKYNFSGTGSGGYSGVAKASAEGFDYSLLFRPSVHSGLNGTFLRLGGHSSKENVSVTGINVRGNKVDTSGTGYLYGLGYDIANTQTIDIRLQWTHMQKIAGISDEQANVFSVGFLAKF